MTGRNPTNEKSIRGLKNEEDAVVTEDSEPGPLVRQDRGQRRTYRPGTMTMSQGLLLKKKRQKEPHK